MDVSDITFTSEARLFKKYILIHAITNVKL